MLALKLLVLVNGVGNLSELVTYFSERVTIDDVLGHIVVEKTRGESDLDGSLDFVAREHPNLDTGLLQRHYGRLDVFLEPVFDRR